MLAGKLYSIEANQNDGQQIDARLIIDSNHDIFKGHFPGQPVLPGVCMLQIIKEMLEKALDKKLFMFEAAQCKFLSMVDPSQQPQLQVQINYKLDEEKINTNSVLKSGEQTVLKAVISFQ